MVDLKLPYAGDEEEVIHTHTSHPAHDKRSANVPAIIGFIILVIVVMWGIVHLIVLAQPWFSSLIPKPTVSNPISSAPTLSKPVFDKPVTTAQSQVPATRPSASPADLSVRIIAVGIIDPVTGIFVNRPPASPSDVAAVQFDISNDGGSTTGLWYFHAFLPSTPSGYSYDSPVQESLGPGDRVINTLRFSPVVSNGGLFNVIVDSQGTVDESDETNNTATVVIPMPAYY
ncbi:hypothetical protein HZC00_01420 [Candidatus Kaiserbacteria bacterium]|nr:hypothetical protein [Candidatus Kaiserbacteria bacterium]